MVASRTCWIRELPHCSASTRDSLYNAPPQSCHSPQKLRCDWGVIVNRSLHARSAVGREELRPNMVLVHLLLSFAAVVEAVRPTTPLQALQRPVGRRAALGLAAASSLACTPSSAAAAPSSSSLGPAFDWTLFWRATPSTDEPPKRTGLTAGQVSEVLRRDLSENRYILTGSLSPDVCAPQSIERVQFERVASRMRPACSSRRLHLCRPEQRRQRSRQVRSRSCW